MIRHYELRLRIHNGCFDVCPVISARYSSHILGSGESTKITKSITRKELHILLDEMLDKEGEL